MFLKLKEVPLIIAFVMVSFYSFSQDSTYIPDANFKRILKVTYNLNIRGDSIANTDATAITALADLFNKGIENLEGIEAFINLTELKAYGNALTKLDLSRNTKLDTLEVSNNKLTSLILPTSETIGKLLCNDNLLSSLNIKGSGLERPQQTFFKINKNPIACVETNVDMISPGSSGRRTKYRAWIADAIVMFNTNCFPIETITPNRGETVIIEVEENQLGVAYVAGDTKAIYSLGGEDASEFSITLKGLLTFIMAPNYEERTRYALTLTVTEGTEVITQSITITITNVNETPTIGGIPNTAVNKDGVYSFEPTGNDVDENTMLEYSINNKPDWATFEEATGLLSGTPTSTGKTTGIVISVSDGILTASLPEFSITVVANKKTYIPDANFRKVLSDSYGLNILGDSIADVDAASITELNGLLSENIENLKGIEAFINLTELNVSLNSITELDLSKNTALIRLLVNGDTEEEVTNQLTSLDLSKNTKLTTLEVSNNKLTSLILPTSETIGKLLCNNNLLRSLNIKSSGLERPMLTTLNIIDNPLACVETNVDLRSPGSSGRRIGGSSWSVNTGTIFNVDCTQVSLPITITSNGGLETAEINVEENQVKVTDIISMGGTGTIHYSLGGADGSLFSITPEGLLTFNIAPDYEATPIKINYTLTVTVTDSTTPTNLTDTQTINITITDIEEVSIPDENFEKALIELKYDTDGIVNGVISQEDALDITRLRINDPENNNKLSTVDAKITDLTGIEAMINLAILNFDDNNVAGDLDLSSNTALTEVRASNNMLTSLDLSSSIALTSLQAANNNLTFLNIKNGFNSLLTNFHILGNASICVQVDDENYRPDSGWIFIEETTTFSEDCLTPTIISNGGGETANIAIEENQVKVTDVISMGGTGTIHYSLEGADDSLFSITLEGLLTFNIAPDYEATPIKINYTLTVTVTDSTTPTNLTDTQTINITITDIEEVSIPDENFEKALIELKYDTDGIVNGVISQEDALNITRLDINDPENNIRLSTVDAKITDLTGIEAMINLAILNFDDNNVAGDLDLSNNIALTEVRASNNMLTSLDLSSSTALTSLQAANNNLTFLNIKNGFNSLLTDLYILGNTSICVQVDSMDYRHNSWVFTDDETTFSEDCLTPTITSNGGGETANIAIEENQVKVTRVISTGGTGTIHYSLGGADGSQFSITPEGLLTFNIAPDYEASPTKRNYTLTVTVTDSTTPTNLTDTQTINITITDIEEVSIPDENFEKALIDLKLDSDGIVNGVISQKDALKIRRLDINDPENNIRLSTVNTKITDLTGIEAMINLESLNFDDNNVAGDLDLSSNTALTEVRASNNMLTSLDLSSSTALSSLQVEGNELTFLNIKNGFNSLLTDLRILENTSICVQVDNMDYRHNSWVFIDDETTFSEDCSIPVITSQTTSTNENTIAITGTAVEGSTVTLTQNGDALEPVTVDSDGTWSVSVTLQEGNNIFTATATDQAGNTSGVSNSVTVTLDTVAPTITITTTTPQTVKTAAFTLAGTVEAGATVDVLKGGTSIGAASVTGTNWMFAVTLDEGANAFTATASDATGNKSDATAAVTVTLDTVAPTVAITTTAKTVNEALFTLAGTVEAGSTVDVLKGGTSIGTASVTGTDWTFAVTLADGGNTFTATATDVAGNTSAPTAAVSITLDMDAPMVTIATATPQTVKDASLTLTGTVEAGSTVDVLKGGTSIGTASVTGTDWTFAVTLADGGNTFTATATDVAGNTSAPTAAVSITLDMDAPMVTIATATPQTVKDASLTLTGTVEAGSTVDVLKGGTSIGTASVTGTDWTFAVTLADGGNTFTATATDVAGNTSAPTAAVSITLDMDAPMVTIATATPQTVKDASLTLTGTVEAGSTVDVLKGGTSIGTASVTGTDWTFAVTLADGGNTFTATATDVAGNTSAPTAAVSITLDMDAPMVTIATATPQTVKDASLTLTGTVEAGSTVDVLKGGTSIGTASVTGTDWTFAVTLADGGNTFTATATDVAGNTSAPTAAVSITLDMDAPMVTIATATPQTVKDASLTLTGTVEAGSTVDVLKGGTSIGTASVTGTDWTFAVTLADGGNTFTATATDVAGNTSAPTAAVSITLDMDAPMVTIATATPQTVKDASLTLTGTVEAGSTVDVLKGGTSIGTASVTGTDWTFAVTLADGGNTFTATATDVAGNTSAPTAAVSITLDMDAPMVTIATATPQTVKDASLTLTGTVEAGSTVDVLKGGTSIGTASVTGTDWTFAVTLADGGNTFTATATDVAGNTSAPTAAVSITLDMDAPMVTIATATPQTVKDASLTLTGTVEAGSTVDVLKGGTSIGTASVTGTDWTFAVTLADGGNTFTATATDVAGNTSAPTAAVSITLDMDAPMVTIATATPQTVKDASLTLTGTVEAGSTVDVLKGGTSIGTASVTGTDWTFAVTLADGGNTFTATATDVAGNTSAPTAAVSITLDMDAPMVTIATATPQTVKDASLTLTGTVEAGSTVDVLKGGTSIGTASVTGTDWTFAVTLADGGNTFTATATDVAGNTSAPTAAVSITLDMDAPMVTIATATPQTVKDASLTLTGTVEAGSTVDVLKGGTSIGTASVTGTDWTFAVTLADGGNTFTATATDVAGNTSAPTAAVSITLDMDAPMVTIATATPQTVKDASLTLTGTVEAGSTVDVLKGGTSIGTASVTGTDWTFAVTLADGGNTFTATATDVAGNTSAPTAAVSITLDMDAPMVTIATATPQTVKDASLTLTGTVEAGSTVDVLKGGTSIGTASVTGTDWTFAVTLADGGNTFTATATDVAGNTSAPTAAVSITLDMDAPMVTIATATPQTVKDASLTLTGTVEAGSTVDVLKGGTSIGTASVTGTDWTFAVTLADGGNTFTATATDVAGNTSAPTAAVSITLDMDAPMVTIATATPQTVKDASLTLTGTVEAGSTVDVLKGGTSIGTASVTGTDWTFAVTLADGGNTFTATATDVAGNTSAPTAAVSITLDMDAPMVTIATATPQTVKDASLTLTGTVEAGSTVDVLKGGTSIGTASVTGTDWTFAVTLADGGNTFTATATDVAGNTSAPTAAVSITLDMDAPMVTIATATPQTVKDASLTLTGTVEAGSTVDVLKGGTSIGTASVTGTDWTFAVTLADGGNTFTATATDVAGNTSAPTAAVSITLDMDAPMVTIATATPQTVKDASLTLTGTVEAGSTVDVLKGGTSIGTASVTGTDWTFAVTLADGGNTFTATATDVAGNTSAPTAAVSITLDMDAPMVTIATATPQTVKDASLTLTGTVEAGSTVDVLKGGTSIGTASVTGTDWTFAVTLADGGNTFTATATDVAGNTSAPTAAVSITLDMDAPMVTIATATPQTVKDASLTLTGTVEAGSTVDVLKGGTSIGTASVTGTDWTFAVTLADGGNTFTATATDVAGNTSAPTAAVSITLDMDAPMVTIATATPQTVKDASLTLTGTVEAGSTVDVLKGGTSIGTASVTGTDWTFAVTLADGGNTFTATATDVAGNTSAPTAAVSITLDMDAPMVTIATATPQTVKDASLTLTGTVEAGSTVDVLKGGTSIGTASVTGTDWTFAVTLADGGNTFTATATDVAGNTSAPTAAVSITLDMDAPMVTIATATPQTVKDASLTLTGTVEAGSTVDVLKGGTSIGTASVTGTDWTFAVTLADGGNTFTATATDVAGNTSAPTAAVSITLDMDAPMVTIATATPQTVKDASLTLTGTVEAGSTVDVLKGGTSIGTASVTGTDWTFAVTLADGGNTFTATATDVAGNTSAPTAAVSITLDMDAPMVTIATATPQTVKDASLTLTGTVEAGSTVDVLKGGTSIGTASVTGTDWTFAVTLADGGNTFTATATDVAGNTSAPTAAVSITLDMDAPMVTIATATPQTVKDASLTLTGTVEAGSTVDVLKGGTSIGTASVTGTDWTFAVTLADGGNTFTATATDVAGNTSAPTAAVSITLDMDAPMVTIATATPQTVKDASLTLTGTVEAGSTVDVLKGGTSIGTASVTGTDWTFAVTLADGGNTFTATATDVAGNTSAPTAAVSITLDMDAPMVTIATATPQTVKDASLTLTGTVEAGSTVDVLKGGTSIGTASVTGTDWTFAVTLADGGNTFTATATDVAGNTSAPTAAVSITLDMDAPMVTIATATPQTVKDASLTLTGTVEAGSTVDVLKGGTSIGTASVTGTDWTFAVTLADGGNTFTATATDVAGNTSAPTAAVSITLDMDAPMVTIATATPQTVKDASLTLTGTVEAGSTVDVLKGGTSIGTASVTGTDWTFAVTLADGGNTFTATATDVAGNTSAPTAAVSITLDMDAPMVTIATATPQTVKDASLTLTGTVEAGSTVDVLKGGTSIGTASVTGTDWTFAVTLADGGNTFTATATDVAGNTSAPTAAVSITLDMDAPMVTIATATPQTVKDASLTLTGTVEAGSTVDVLKGGTSIGTASVTGTDWTFAVTLADGGNTFTATATDVAGNTSAPTAAVSITLDMDAPMVTIATATPQTVKDASLTLTGTVEAGSTVDVLKGGTSIGTASVTGTDWTFAVTLADGGNTFTATATDVAGNTSAPTAAVSITLDMDAPMVTIATATPQTVKDASLTLTGTVEAGSTVDVLKGGTSIGTASVTGTDWTFAVTLADGGNTFTATATDVAGNTSAPTAAVSITLDMDAPMVTIATATPQTVKDASLTLTGTVEAGSTVDVLKGGTSIGTASVTGTDWTFAVTLADGGNTFTATATDVAGNTSAPTAAVSITLDMDAPMVTIATATPQTVKDASLTLTGTVEAGSTVDVLKGGTSIGTASVTGTDWTFAVTLADGGNTFTATATDVAGNTSAPTAAVSITLDMDAPMVTIATATPQTVKDASLTLTGTVEAGSTVDVLKGGTSIGTASVTGTDWTFAVTLADGGNTFTATATDVAGNTSAPTAAVSITLDMDAPMVTIATATPQTVKDASLTLTGTVEAGSTVDVLKGGTSIGTASVTGTDWTFAVTLADGGNTFTATATDVAGNTSAPTAAVSITLDMDAPMVTIATATPQTVKDASLTLTGTVEAGSTVDVLKGGTSIGTASVTGTDWTFAVTLADGGNTFTATATDVAGNTSAPTAAVSITLDMDAPMVTIATATPQTVKDASLTLTGTVEAGSTVDVLKGGTSIGTASVTGTDWTFAVTLADGGNTFTATATDVAGNTSAPTAAVSITLDMDAPMVTIATATPQTVKDASLTLTGTVEAGSTVDVLKGGTSIGTASVTGTDWTFAVTLADGGNTFTATATDVAGNTSAPTAAVSITLDMDAPMVTIATATPQTVKDASLTLTGTVEAGSTVDVLKGGTSIGTASVTGTDWTFAVTLADGGNTFTATATDVAGNTSAASEAVTVTLDMGVPAAPVITAPTSTVVNTASLTLEGTAEAGATVDVLKDGASIGAANVSGGTWSKVVTLTDGDNVFTATASDAAGNTSAASEAVTVTLDSDAPTVAVVTTAMDVTFSTTGNTITMQTSRAVTLTNADNEDFTVTSTLDSTTRSHQVTNIESGSIVLTVTPAIPMGATVSISYDATRGSRTEPITYSDDNTSILFDDITLDANDIILANEDFETAGFSIFPNPTSSILNITANEKADYQLLNIRGQTLKKGILAKGRSEINISSFAKGVYLLKINTEKRSLTRKVVKD